MDCGDYANEAIEREIPELPVALVAGKARPESTQHGRSRDKDHGEAVGLEGT